MQVKRIIFVFAGTFDNQPIRTHMAHFGNSPDAQARWLQSTDGGYNLSDTAIYSIANDIIRPSTEIIGQSTIANGFDMQRLRFIMEVEHDNNTTQYLSGYTNHVGISGGGYIDQSMILYFDKSVVMSHFLAMGPHGQFRQSRVAEASNLLTAESVQHVGANPVYALGNQHAPATMRPVDVLSTFDAVKLAQAYNDLNDTPTRYHTSTAEFTKGVRKSRLSNSNAADYLGSVVKNFSAAKSMVADEYGDGADTMFNTPSANAASKVGEGFIDADAFIMHMQEYAIRSMQEGGNITWGSLLSACPEVQYCNNLMDLHNNRGLEHHAPRRGQAIGWESELPQTMIATVLRNSLPSIILNRHATSIDLTISSVQTMASINTMAPTNPVQVAITSLKGLASLDIQAATYQLQHYIQETIGQAITRNGEIPLIASGHIDVFGNYKFDIAYDNEPPVPYSSPQFASSIYSPMIAGDSNYVGQQSVELLNICENYSV